MTPFTEDTALGHAFAPRRIVEVEPHRVYALSGFELTEYYFIVSDDGRELIGIDAGDAGGYREKRLRGSTGVYPNVRFYARNNYREEIARALNAPQTFGRQFFGTGFHPNGEGGMDSDNYLAGEAGFSLRGSDGYLEINDVLIRGTKQTGSILLEKMVVAGN